MSYFYAKKTDLSFDKAVEKTTEELQKRGFGILTEIDVKATLKKKLDVDFRNYKILGACNPPNAFKVLSSEPHIGVMLPCNAIVQEYEDGSVEVAVIDPLVAMQSVNNSAILEPASEIAARLKEVIDSL